MRPRQFPSTYHLKKKNLNTNMKDTCLIDCTQNHIPPSRLILWSEKKEFEFWKVTAPTAKYHMPHIMMIFGFRVPRAFQILTGKPQEWFCNQQFSVTTIPQLHQINRPTRLALVRCNELSICDMLFTHGCTNKDMNMPVRNRTRKSPA